MTVIFSTKAHPIPFLSLSITTKIYFSDDLKLKYKRLYEKHPIHVASKNGAIRLKEVKVDDFSVKLKICNVSFPEDSLRNEVSHYFKRLETLTSDDVEVNQLIDGKDRVTFIRGIAGMGKSVFAKQLAYGWAHGKIFTGVTLCLVFECREINIFRRTYGAELKEHEVLEGFLKAKFNLQFNEVMEIVFVVDGLDELVDESNDFSIIKDLLTLSKYPASKVLITGRPHIENKLEQCGEIGGIRMVELQGLGDIEIKEYVNKFCTSQGIHVDLNRAKDPSNKFLPILHVPQFLNTFCAVASSSSGRKIRNATELYSWTLWVFLKQHAYKKPSGVVKIVSETIKDCADVLLALSNVCYKLVNDNKVILFKEDVETLLGKNSNKKEFMDSFLVDVSDAFKEKFQFKHLSLMEFLSAVHICCSTEYNELIKENLEKKGMDVLIFACQLVAGYEYDGIIKEILVSVDASINRSTFCITILQLLPRYDYFVDSCLSRSLDVIVAFLNEDLKDKHFLVRCIKVLQFHGAGMHTKNISKLYDIIDHLLKYCDGSDSEIQAVLGKQLVGGFNVNQLKLVPCARYFKSVGAIGLHDMDVPLNAIQNAVEAVGCGKFEMIWITNCKLDGNGSEIAQSSLKVESVRMNYCREDVRTLINALHWSFSLSCHCFEVWRQKLEIECWEMFVKAIEEHFKRTGRMLWMKLILRDCFPEISKELQNRVRKFPITLLLYCYNYSV